MAEIGKDINKAKELLLRGELVAIPTETVYGLAGNALDQKAVVKIFEVKNRPHFDPLIVHVPSLNHAERYVENVPPPASALTQQFWPGPLTLLLEKKIIIPDIVTAGASTVGIRCPDHRLTRELLNAIQFPLAAPSANPFGYVSPTSPEHVNDQLGERIAYILDGGQCRVGIESTIIGFESSLPVIYRTGGLSLEDIEAVVGKVVVQAHSSSNPKAPGQLKSHYAPAKKMVIGKIEELLHHHPAHCSAILSFRENLNAPHQFVLSPSGSLQEAAHNLFTGLRLLDKMPVTIILAEYVPDNGLGRAINDRLRRAAARE
jgi:L-threonylcarbamoyladenylate synthase